MQVFVRNNMSRLVGKPTICIGENKGADQQAKTKAQISAFVFATRILQFLYFLNPKFQASSSFLCLYRPVCVGPVRKPHCWFSHEVAHIPPMRAAVCSLVTRLSVCRYCRNADRKANLWRENLHWSLYLVKQQLM